MSAKGADLDAEEFMRSVIDAPVKGPPRISIGRYDLAEHDLPPDWLVFGIDTHAPVRVWIIHRSHPLAAMAPTPEQAATPFPTELPKTDAPGSIVGKSATQTLRSALNDAIRKIPSGRP